MRCRPQAVSAGTRRQDKAEGTATLARQVKHSDLFFVSPRRPAWGQAHWPGCLLCSFGLGLSLCHMSHSGTWAPFSWGWGGLLLLTTAAEAGGPENVPVALMMLTHRLLSHETLPQSLPLTPLPSGPNLAGFSSPNSQLGVRAPCPRREQASTTPRIVRRI